MLIPIILIPIRIILGQCMGAIVSFPILTISILIVTGHMRIGPIVIVDMRTGPIVIIDMRRL